MPDCPGLGLPQRLPGRFPDQLGGLEDGDRIGHVQSIGTTKQLGDCAVDAAEVQPATDGVQGGGVVVNDLDERGADSGPAAQSQYDGWCLGGGRVRQPDLQGAGAGVQQAPVHVEDGRLVAG
jgi:hypothetical protein